jgi:toxin ParE1/3/4
MRRRLIVRSEAEADITYAAVRYESREPRWAWNLVSEIQAAIERALNNPEVFPCLRDDPPVRRVLTRRFSFGVFFIVRPDALVMFAVLNAARHDLVWSTACNRSSSPPNISRSRGLT